MAFVHDGALETVQYKIWVHAKIKAWQSARVLHFSEEEFIA